MPHAQCRVVEVGGLGGGAVPRRLLRRPAPAVDAGLVTEQIELQQPAGLDAAVARRLGAKPEPAVANGELGARVLVRLSSHVRDDAVVQPVVEAAGRIVNSVHFGEPVDGQLPVAGSTGRDGERRTDEPGIDGLGRGCSRAGRATGGLSRFERSGAGSRDGAVSDSVAESSSESAARAAGVAKRATTERRRRAAVPLNGGRFSLVSIVPLKLGGRESSLDSRGAAARQRANLFQGRHCRVARKRGQQRPVRPTEAHRLLGREALEEPIEQTGREAVTSAHSVQHIQLGDGRGVALTAHPGDRAPKVAVGRIERREESWPPPSIGDTGPPPESIISKNAPGSSRPPETGCGPAMFRAFCRSSSLPTRTSVCRTIRSSTSTAFCVPPQTPQSLSRKLRSKLTTAPAAFAARMPSRITSPVVSDSEAKSAAVKPADALGEDGTPIEVAWLELTGRFVGAVIDDRRRAHTETAVAVHRRQVRPPDAVVGEPFVEGLDAHGPHSLRHQVPDG